MEWYLLLLGCPLSPIIAEHAVQTFKQSFKKFYEGTGEQQLCRLLLTYPSQHYWENSDRANAGQTAKITVGLIEARFGNYSLQEAR